MAGPTTMMAAISLRAATAADIPAITAIYDHAVRYGTASFELDPPSEAEMLRRQGALLDAGYPYLVAADEGRVVGYAYAGPFRPRPAYRYAVEDSVYVAADAQRRGIGRLLLGALIARASEAEFRQMIAVIGDSSLQAASIALHTAAGFRMIGTLDGVGHKFGRWLDSVYMQRALGHGSDTPPN
jgi:phosphinothricin acetyltransferase